MVTICILLLNSHQQKELVVSQVGNNSGAQPPVYSSGLAAYVWLSYGGQIKTGLHCASTYCLFALLKDSFITSDVLPSVKILAIFLFFLIDFS